MQKFGRIFTNILLTLLVIIALVIVVPNIFGVKTCAVLSGSMEPAIPTGSMVFTVPVEGEEIREGDPVTYVLNKKGTLSTHRVVEIDDANRQLIVKGDANDANDPNPVLWDNVVGVVRFQIPLLGYILGFVLTTPGKIIAATVIVALIILIALCGGKERAKNKKQEPKGMRKHSYGQDKPEIEWNNSSARRVIGQMEKEPDSGLEAERTFAPYSKRGWDTPRYGSPGKQVSGRGKRKKQTYSRENRYVPRHSDIRKGGGEDEV